MIVTRASQLRSPRVEWAIASLVVTLVVMFSVSAFIVGFDVLARDLRLLDYTTIAFCLALMLWQQACRCLRWFLFTRSLGVKVSPADAALFYAGGLGMALTPGRVGELLRLWFLEKKYLVPYRRIAGLYLADRVSDVYTYLLFFSVGSIAYKHGSAIVWGIFVVAAAGTLAIMYPRSLLIALSAVYSVPRRGRGLVLWLRRALRNTSTLFQPRIFIPGFAVGAIGWAAAPGVLLISLSQMGVSLPPLQAFAIYAVTALTGGASMLPGGVGAAEPVLVGLLAASDVPLDVAISAMIVTRIAFAWLPVGLGIIVLPFAMKGVHTPRMAELTSVAVGP